MTKHFAAPLTFGALAFWLAASAVAQAPAIVPISQVLEDSDGDLVPDRRSDTVVIRGILINDPFRFGDQGALANLQDSTAGIGLFGSESSELLSMARGDSLEVRGAITQFRGGEFLRVTSVERLGSVEVPEPKHVLAAEARGERLSGQLVRLAGVIHPYREEGNWAQAELEDRSGTIQVVLPPDFLTDPQSVQHLKDRAAVELVGIISQSTGSQPPDDGYFLFPRDLDDFQFAPVPPYEALGVLATALIFLGLLGWRRSASRRAQRLEELSLQLERSRDQIREREARLRSLVENAADTISVVTAEGEILYQSPSVQRMLGWPATQVTGRNMLDFVHPRDREAMQQFLRTLAGAEGETHEIEVMFRSMDGGWHYLEILGTARLDDPAVGGIVCNARDITEHRSLQEQLRQADRMEVVGRLAGGIAHDFNNLLTALRGHAEMALAEIPRDSGGRGDVEEVVRAATRAASLTKQLLAFSRQQVLKPRVVDPGRIVGELMPMMRRLIGENVELHATLSREAGFVCVDSAQFEQVVMNLVVNARDAMPQGGVLNIELSAAHLPEDDLAASSGPGQREYVRLTISDTGTGMSPEVMHHIFEPFYTTKEQGKGTGLGLATLYGIVKQSDGDVLVHSEVGGGTRFDVYFPRIDAPLEEEESKHPRDDNEHEIGSGVILLVEDDHPVRHLARRVLEKGGFTVLEAATPSAAIDIADNYRDAIDLLLTDVVMPEMSGLQLAGVLRESGLMLPTLFTSGYTEDEVVRHGVVSGEAMFLDKPFTPADLLNAVRAALVQNAGGVAGGGP